MMIPFSWRMRKKENKTISHYSFIPSRIKKTFFGRIQMKLFNFDIDFSFLTRLHPDETI